MRAAPLAYLDAFERLFIAPGINPRRQSNEFLPSFLKLVAQAAPDRVRALAGRLLGQYDAALSVADHAAERELGAMETLPEDTAGFVRSLDQQRWQLRVLVGTPPAQRPTPGEPR